jgi:hypothetical protein
MVLACQPSLAGEMAHDGAHTRVALTARSPRVVRAQWRAGSQPSGARSTMRFSRRAPGGLQRGVGQDFVDWGLPTCLGDGEVATDGGTEEFVDVGWARVTGNVLGELLQLEEGRGR